MGSARAESGRIALSGRLLRIGALAAALSLLAAGCGSKTIAAKAKASPKPSAQASPSAVPVVCPLTGAPAPGGSVPNRPALGVKVENSPESRPQTGLNTADIIYEEPVEGGITRFLAIYQCQGAARIEAVRSARVQDISILAQFGKPLFGNAGSSPPTAQMINAAVAAGTLVNIDFNGPGYQRDPARGNGVHSLYTSTRALYGRADAKKAGGVPKPVFTYAASPPPGGPGATVHIGFSGYSDVYWRWDATAGVYQRYYGSSPAMQSNGTIISSPNVIVESVPVAMSWWIEDSSGSHQPIPNLVGTGNALVCRQGTCVSGTWNRPSLSDVTQYLTATGTVVPLVPGQTWVELAPSSVTGPTAIPVASVSAS